MAFKGIEGSPIEAEVAGSWTRKFRETFKDGNTGHFFGRDILIQLLEQPDAVGIRFYYGLDKEGQRQLIAVAVDGDQNDQLGDSRIVADDSCPCPPWISQDNVLNS